MSQVRVPKDAFINGELPNICAISGIVARENYLLAATSPGGPIAGAVPMSASSVAGLRSLQKITLAMFLLSIATTAAGMGTRSVLFAGLGISFLISAGASLFVTYRRGIRAKVEGNEVLLKHVHPTFVKSITSPKAGCEGCTNAGACSVSEMETCDRVDA